MVLDFLVQNPLGLQGQHAPVTSTVCRSLLFSSGWLDCQMPFTRSSTGVLTEGSLEEWGFVDDRDLESFKGHKSCSTCNHFGYVTLGQCQVLGSCHLRQGLLAPGSSPLKSCKHWANCSQVDPYNSESA